MPAPLFIPILLVLAVFCVIAAIEKHWSAILLIFAMIAITGWLVVATSAEPVILSTEIVNATHTPDKSYIVYTNNNYAVLYKVSGTAKQYKVEIYDRMYYGILFRYPDHVKVTPILEEESK